MRLVKASEMQEMDRMCIQEIGIPGVVLMENAARGAVRVFLEHFDPPRNSHVLILCGRGNNGGDGYVMARYLHQAGLKVKVVLLSEFEKISGDAKKNLEIIKRMGLEFREVRGREQMTELLTCLEESDMIIDGILGTGLNTDVKDFYRGIIERINGSGRRVMAIDIPSGLNADTGQIMGAAIKADLTVTFGFPKIGQLLFPGADLVGRLVRVDIGIPSIVADRIEPGCMMIEPNDLWDLFRPPGRNIHKGDRGHLLIIAGSRGKTGAAALSALGALRAGAGLVTLAVPESLNSILESKVTEVMTEPLPETSEGSLSLKGKEAILSLSKGKKAIAIGPGLSTHPETVALVREIVKEAGLPMVIDADGLNALAGDAKAMEKLDGNKILTPHPGEMGRLAGLQNKEVQSDRVGTATGFVEKNGCYLVLKGVPTIIAEPGGKSYLNSSGNPSLAAAGTGDVLTGLISGFLTRGLSMLEASVSGVYIHGLAADILAQKRGETGMLAGELLDVIPEVSEFLYHKEWPLESSPPFLDFYTPL